MLQNWLQSYSYGAQSCKMSQVRSRGLLDKTRMLNALQTGEWVSLLNASILISLIGLQGDVSDPRTKSFLYILDILPRLQKLPKYLLLENVKGFECSSARNELLRTLETCGFKYQEFLLSPTCAYGFCLQLGIPNSRLRYFLIAKLHQEPFSFQAPGQILTRFPDQDLEDLLKDKVTDKVGEVSSSLSAEEKNPDPNIGPDCRSKKSLPKGAFLFKLETVEEIERKHGQNNDSSIQMLKDFLEEENEEMSQYFLPPKSLLRYAFLLDIVKPTCRRSTCFTKGYGHYVEGTGSVLQTAVDVQLESVFKRIEELPEEEKLMKLSTLKLRYFTPREIANLHGFPLEFGFPDKITIKQCYRLLGNSLNVHVVAKLISILLG
ncbi:tRNA (cytosine(38)-C(5))-methyltransferase isoform X4 [Calonectris borealis]|uniref:tRNA (cytosine(38)-C(5))-methyltransferase isoform X4 n=2 Tax=Calonectris borealis TaxID=1323832 RepID=UPI003F4C7220